MFSQLENIKMHLKIQLQRKLSEKIENNFYRKCPNPAEMEGKLIILIMFAGIKKMI